MTAFCATRSEFEAEKQGRASDASRAQEAAQDLNSTIQCLALRSDLQACTYVCTDVDIYICICREM